MFNAAIVEVAIGLIFIFSLLSILVTQINSVIVNILNLKATRLKEQLDEMLSDPVVRAKILAHPLIRMVDTEVGEFLLTDSYEGTRLTEEVARRMTENKKARVDYISQETFVDVLVDVLTENTGQKLYEALANVIDKMEPSVEKSKFRQLLRQIQISGTGLNEMRALIETLADPETKKQMLVALNLVDSALDKLKAENSDLIPLLLGVRQIKDKYLETALIAVLNTASNIQQARSKLAEWFEGSMSRATRKYTDELQRFSLVISFLLALLLNVDTLFTARVLWEDPALRTSVAATALATASELEQDIQNGLDPETAESTLEDVQDAVDEAQATLETLLELRLPIGWVIQPVDETTINPDLSLSSDRLDPRNLWQFWPPNNPDGWLELWVLKIIGLALTTIALAQGAPFWFDMLRRLTRGGSSNS
ncbi:MAG: hypothetical protein CL610_17245 [Anaerolineaceae bacterium]|nr:hypothetical protein [Anaerolineaceae bacterium]